MGKLGPLNGKRSFVGDVESYCFHILLRTTLWMSQDGYQINRMGSINDGFVNVVCRLEGLAVMIPKTDGNKNYSRVLLV